MNDIKLKLQPGHTEDLDWMAETHLWQIFWNITHECDFKCSVCFSNAGPRSPRELSTKEAKQMIRNAQAAGVWDIVVSGGEPFLRPDLVELLAYMATMGISARIASNGSRITPKILDRISRETSVKSFQISLDTLDPTAYSELHGVPVSNLYSALDALHAIQDHGFHTTVSTRLTSTTLPGIPDLLDKAAKEGWATVTVHCPLHTGRIGNAWGQDTDVLSILEPVFERFLSMSKQWIIETTIPWARYHPVIRKLKKRIQINHVGCGAGRCRLSIDATGQIVPCICACVGMNGVNMGNIREHDLADVYSQSPIAQMYRRPWDYGICSDCPKVKQCGGGCRAAAYVLTGRVDGLDASCPVRRRRMKKAGGARASF